MKYDLAEGISLITMSLNFSYTSLDKPDYARGTQYEKNDDEGIYYVSALLDPTETTSTFRVNGETQTGGQRALIEFLELLSIETFEHLTSEMTEAKRKQYHATICTNEGTTERTAGMHVSKFTMRETTKKGKRVRPLLVDATGAPCKHPDGIIRRGKCDLFLAPVLINKDSNVIRYLKGVQILEVGASTQAGEGFGVEEGYQASTGASFVDETAGMGL